MEVHHHPKVEKKNFIVAYHYLYATTEINNEAAEVSRQHAWRLIDFLKKEYHIN